MNKSKLDIIKKKLLPFNIKFRSNEITKVEYSIFISHALEEQDIDSFFFPYLKQFIFEFKSEIFFDDIMKKCKIDGMKDKLVITSVSTIPQIITKYKIISPTNQILMRFLMNNMFKLKMDDIIYFLTKNFSEKQIHKYLRIFERGELIYETLYHLLCPYMTKAKGVINIPFEKFKDVYNIDEMVQINYYKLDERNFLLENQPYIDEDFIFSIEPDKRIMYSPQQKEFSNIFIDNILTLKISLNNVSTINDFSYTDIMIEPNMVKNSYVF